MFRYLKWINDGNLPIENPDETKLNKEFNQFIWIETLDKTHKVVFSVNAIEPLALAINEKTNHQAIFGKLLHPNSKKKK